MWTIKVWSVHILRLSGKGKMHAQVHHTRCPVHAHQCTWLIHDSSGTFCFTCV